MSNEKTQTLLKSIKENSADVASNFTAAAYTILSEKVAQRKREIAKTLFTKKVPK